MKSLPLIETALSETEQEFIGFVETHPAALYQADSDRGLPGDTVRTRIAAGDPADDVVAEHHTIEFMSLTPEGHWQNTGCIGHAFKEIESLQGSSRQLETRFEIQAPGLAAGEVEREVIESLVQDQLERLKSAHLLNLSNDMVARPART
jgi:hypothetical protein